MEYLKHSTLDNWTYNKALQKTIESFRVDKDTKDILFTVLLISYRRYRFYFPPNLFFVCNPEKH